MARKSGGPPTGHDDEEAWSAPGAEQPLNRSLDRALQVGEDEDDEPDFIYGDIVIDDEADEPNKLVVVCVPGKTTDEWGVGGMTLAEKNPEYPPDDEVIITVKLSVLIKAVAEWDVRESPISVEQLREDEIPVEAYPSLRLVRIKDSHLR